MTFTYAVHTRVGIGIPKYRKYRKIPKFNSIEYWKCSIPKFQYYWILKKIPIPKFNNTEIFGIIPKIPKSQISLYAEKKYKKIQNFFSQIFFWTFFQQFLDFFREFPVFLGIFRYFRDSIPKISVLLNFGIGIFFSIQ